MNSETAYQKWLDVAFERDKPEPSTTAQLLRQAPLFALRAGWDAGSGWAMIRPDPEVEECERIKSGFLAYEEAALRASDALRDAGKAIDDALTETVTTGTLDLLNNPELVDALHRALNGIVAITGKPWRKIPA